MLTMLLCLIVLSLCLTRQEWILGPLGIMMDDGDGCFGEFAERQRREESRMVTELLRQKISAIPWFTHPPFIPVDGFVPGDHGQFRDRLCGMLLRVVKEQKVAHPHSHLNIWIEVEPQFSHLRRDHTGRPVLADVEDVQKIGKETRLRGQHLTCLVPARIHIGMDRRNWGTIPARIAVDMALTEGGWFAAGYLVTTSEYRGHDPYPTKPLLIR